ncbi:MAG TPA: hypothetical protein VGU69_10295 [Rhizomicrobium sp.]|nr:hypothetical protein [Rhizomicrobium sp.]
MTSRNDYVLRIAVIAIGAGCVVGIIHVLGVIGLRVPLDPNEGWNAYFAQAAALHGSPYPAASSLMTNNYPPLSFYFIGLVGGDAIITGRIVALISFMAVAMMMSVAARRMGCTRTEAAFAVLLFASCLLLTSDYVGMDDPQLLGHAVAMGGLLVTLLEPRSPRTMVMAALIFTVAFFIKHNLVLLPITTGAWLLLLDRRLGVTFIISGLIFLLIGMGIFREAFGTGLFTQLAAPRLYHASNIVAAMRVWLPWAAVPTAGTVLLAVLWRRDRYAMFCAIYAATAAGAGIFFLGGDGVDVNALFDADIALSLSAGVLLNRTVRDVSRPVLALIYVLPLAILVFLLGPDWRTSDYWLHPMEDDTAAARSEIELITNAKGPAICEMLSLCYWASKPAEADLFNLGQQYAKRVRSDAAFVSLLDHRAFAIVEFESPSEFAPTTRIAQSLARNYRVIRRDDDRLFMAPR